MATERQQPSSCITFQAFHLPQSLPSQESNTHQERYHLLIIVYSGLSGLLNLNSFLLQLLCFRLPFLALFCRTISCNHGSANLAGLSLLFSGRRGVTPAAVKHFECRLVHGKGRAGKQEGILLTFPNCNSWQ